jgi:hypothetical protein
MSAVFFFAASILSIFDAAIASKSDADMASLASSTFRWRGVSDLPAAIPKAGEADERRRQYLRF